MECKTKQMFKISAVYLEKQKSFMPKKISTNRWCHGGAILSEDFIQTKTSKV
jgi:hypothetical protein